MQVLVMPEGLSKPNGLSIEDNECLAHSQDVHEIIALVLKGITRARPVHTQRTRGSG
jgi:hypothetical protein